MEKDQDTDMLNDSGPEVGPPGPALFAVGEDPGRGHAGSTFLQQAFIQAHQPRPLYQLRCCQQFQEFPVTTKVLCSPSLMSLYRYKTYYYRFY